MKGTIQVAKFANIPVLIHWSFGLIVAWVMYVSYADGSDLKVFLFSLVLILSMFCCVVMHEYGHALTARRFGVDTRDIILFPIGGVARLEYLPEKPLEEFYIAIAGPLVNVAIAVFLSLYFFIDANSWAYIQAFFTEDIEILEQITSPFQLFVPLLIGMNLGIALFNMLPAFPMDGGRIFRALLSLKWSRRRATLIASRLGQILAVGLFCYGVYNFHPVLPLIGIFIFFVANSEYKMVKTDELLKNHTVRDISRTDYTKISYLHKMQKPISISQQSQEKSFLVFNELEKIKGVLHKEFIQEAIQQKAENQYVDEFISPRFTHIQPHLSLKTLHQRMQIEGYSILPVFEYGEIIGVVDRVGLEAFLKKN